MKVFQYLIFIFLFLLIHSCKKENTAPQEKPDPPDPPEEIEFEIPSTEDVVMYEVNLRAYSEQGDISGVIQRLDQIKAMGVNVIWLMPIHPIGEINSVNSPYSVKNYKEVNPELGSISDLNMLVEQAHKKGMAVVLDWVANHTAWDNPWISNKDWYTQDENGNIIPPAGTNWLDVADLDYTNHEMRGAMIDAMKYWITNSDIDGFRCDAADMIPFDFWKQAFDSLDNFTEKDLVLLAEGTRQDHFSAGFDVNFSWNFYNRLKSVFSKSASTSSLFSLHNSEYSNIPDGKQWLRFTTNHDESAWDATPMVLFNGEEGALAASVISIYLGGLPLIYGSQEVGVVENVPFFTNEPIDWLLNPDMKISYEKMLSFYTTSETIKHGKLTTYNHSSVVVFTLELNQETVLILVNTYSTEVNYDVPSDLTNKTWQDVLNSNSITLDDQIKLSPYQFLILKEN